jgi:two-component system nitrogen regulation sensor histidine kinase NtrY
MSRRGKPLTFEARLLAIALVSALPGVSIALAFTWTHDFAAVVKWTLSAAVLGAWLSGLAMLRARIVRPLQTLANLIEAIRVGDFSLRGHGASRRDAMGEVLWEVNALADALRGQHLAALEAHALVNAVLEQIDVGIFAFDADKRLRLVNRAAEELLGKPRDQLASRSASELGIDGFLSMAAPGRVDFDFPSGQGPWELRRTSFRQGGVPHQLVVVTDLRRALREQERQAWQRLVRVLSHEINNSLAPIQSLADGQLLILGKDARPRDWEADLATGLSVISRRSEGLARFMTAYARLARLPPPSRGEVQVGEWVRRVAALDARVRVEVEEGPHVAIHGDADQLDQLLVNLVRNAVDASLETGGGVFVRWHATSREVTIAVGDEGLGVADQANLFVPFFTTKSGGSGIGLALSRQIAEAHDGVLALDNRPDCRGAVATLRLPRAKVG